MCLPLLKCSSCHSDIWINALSLWKIKFELPSINSSLKEKNILSEFFIKFTSFNDYYKAILLYV